MKEITTKLRVGIEDQLIPFLQEHRDAGKSNKELEALVLLHARLKIRHFYQKQHDLKPVKGDTTGWLQEIESNKADSKAEVIFSKMMVKSEIPFKFQYKIGSYRVDYLVDDVLVVELDGPQHNQAIEYDKKRDKYLNKLGYRVLRIPLMYLILDEEAVIKAVKEARG